VCRGRRPPGNTKPRRRGDAKMEGSPVLFTVLLTARRPARRASAFTLTELMIVIVILGIMAAVATPQFANASSEARRSSLATQCRTMANQVQFYKLQHGDTLPDLAAASAGGNHFQPLVGVTVYGGRNFGPYAQNVAENPITEGSTVMNATTFTNGVPDPVPGADFVYDYGGGQGSGNIWGTSDRATGTPVQ
jgi:prepilin-type N-terminal cleavage/methylation domain-containing protein